MLTAISIALCAASVSTQADTIGDRVGGASDRVTATRVIPINANTRWANVNQDEVVTFVSGGHEFSWNFDGTQPRVSLQQIAPADFNAKDIYVYVGTDYRSIAD